MGQWQMYKIYLVFGNGSILLHESRLDQKCFRTRISEEAAN